jgi:choline dehydrogenase
VYANGQVVAHPRGKQLGGSSAINFMFWTHALQQDIDNWGDLGNENWSWNALQPFYTKSEAYVGPMSQVQEDLQTQYIDSALHGTNGPTWNTFPDIYGPLDVAWPRVYENLGLGVNSDPRDGLALGGYTNLINMDLNGRKRSYAATGYYLPASKRPNLTVLTGAYVKKIILEKTAYGSGVKATGVQYSLGSNSTMELVGAEKEVILSAGSIGSPKILELSGVGGPKILSKYDIDVVVPNPNVGENLQDHIYVPIG